MTTKFAVPTDPAKIHTWSENFKVLYGMPPIAGGETPTETPPTPAPPTQPAPDPTPAPDEGTPPPEVAAQPAADSTPEWAQKLLDGMDQLAPPAQVDPLAVELGLAPEPPQPLPGQPGFDPSQAGPPAGQPEPGTLPPGQAAVPDSQSQPADPQTELVSQYIDKRAEQVAERMLQERVAPYFQHQEQNRRRDEGQAFVDDYPELKDPDKWNALRTQARAWGQQTIGNPAVADEPGFLEVVHLAMKGLEAAQNGQQPGAAGSGEVPIEGGGGAQPGPTQTNSDELAQRIVDAKPGGNLDPIWT